MNKAVQVSNKQARLIWLNATGLLKPNSFGKGAKATVKAIQHLGYVQIDTINVIERCHHHILYNRISDYKREHLHQAQKNTKDIFEYWTHALAYVPVVDFKYFVLEMQRMQNENHRWFQSVTEADLKKVFSLIKKNGPVSIRDVKDDVLVEKEHDWSSKKPSKKAMQFAFYRGELVISEREGMLKKYELTNRHFGWKKLPKAASEAEVYNYQLDRALRSMGFVDLPSVCHNYPSRKPIIKKIIEQRLAKKQLVEINVDKQVYYIEPSQLEKKYVLSDEQAHILSPFDPLIIQRKRLLNIFDYEHIFEAYVAKHKRKFGYFTLPVLRGDEVICLLDLKADREQQKLLIQSWHWLKKNKDNKLAVEKELNRFEKFQLAK